MVPQLAAAAGFLFRESSQKAMAQTITDSSDPAAVARQQKLDRALDKIRGKYGAGAVVKGSEMTKGGE